MPPTEPTEELRTAEARRKLEAQSRAYHNGSNHRDDYGEWESCPHPWCVADLAASQADDSPVPTAALRTALEATTALPEDVPGGRGGTMYAAGWDERGQAIRAALASQADDPSGPLDVERFRCGRCGDDLLPSELRGHLYSEGREPTR